MQLLLLAMLVSNQGKAQPPTVVRPHVSIALFDGGCPETFDWQNKSPLEFISKLKSGYQKDGVNVFTMSSYHKGWVQKDDLPALEALCDSKEPCLALVSCISSYLPIKGATVGAIAKELIESYKSGGFPSWLQVHAESISARKPGA